MLVKSIEPKDCQVLNNGRKQILYQTNNDVDYNCARVTPRAQGKTQAKIMDTLIWPYMMGNSILLER